MFKRKIYPKLLAQSKDRKVSILLGARQVGKTTLLKQLYEELSKESKCLYLDLDILSNYEKISTYELLLNTLIINGYQENQKGLFYLFLDEFQKYSQVTKIIKNVYDNISNVKIYASGSSSLSIKKEVQESLAGRKLITKIYPLDFEEFLIFSKKEELIKNHQNIHKLQGDNLRESLKEYEFLLKEFMVFGGYPEVALKQTKEEKIIVLESIFDLYVKKDLIDYLKIDKILGAKKLIEFLSVNNGQKIKYEEASKIINHSLKGVKDIIEILEETFIIKVVKPYYTNKNKEIVKIPKIYFIDNGVRNYFLRNFNDLSLRNDSGFLFEGFILSELIKCNRDNIKFWQDKNGNEVDFLLEDELIPIEVKFKNEINSSDFKGIRKFIEEYPKAKNPSIINLNVQKVEKGIELILPYSIFNIKFSYMHLHH
ncbi:MAG: ATP-binding protein [Nanoarchaeota archaeon]